MTSFLLLGCSLNGLPTPSPSPFTKLNTPLGTPTLSKISAKIIAANGVFQKVLTRLDYLPQNAAANFNDVWLVGSSMVLHNPATPIASLTTKSSPRCSSNSKLSSASLAAVK